MFKLKTYFVSKKKAMRLNCKIHIVPLTCLIAMLNWIFSFRYLNTGNRGNINEAKTRFDGSMNFNPLLNRNHLPCSFVPD